MENLSRGLVLFFVLAGTFSSSFVMAVEKIDINSASLEDLIKIIHIGELRAEELISLRPFLSLDELGKIKGIGNSRLEDIKKQGLAWVNENKKELIEASPQSTEPETVIVEESQEEKVLAATGEANQFFQEKTGRGEQVVVIAFLLAVFSGIMILFLKKKIKTG